ncbi:MAG: ribonuclease H-like domain-containing protein [Polyangiaceae bacterium]|nr:ribonuclease H-like domain-containing protein [Polyangiaceae bacterium]
MKLSKHLAALEAKSEAKAFRRFASDEDSNEEIWDPETGEVMPALRDRPGSIEELRARMDGILGPERRERKHVAIDPRYLDLPTLYDEDRQLLHRSIVVPEWHPFFSLLHAASNEMLSGVGLCDWTVAPDDVLFVDTETTGLAGGAGTVAFLVGLAFFENGKLTFEQWMLADLGDEAALLDVVVERWNRAKGVCSFNGKAFDARVLQTRLVLHRKEPLTEKPHLDVLHVARRIHRDRLQSTKLQALEKVLLGLERGEDIPGAEIGAAYFHFLRTGATEAMRLVLKHNETDVLSLVALFALYGSLAEGDAEVLSGVLVASDHAAIGKTLQRAKRHEASLSFLTTAAEDDAVRDEALVLRSRAYKKLRMVREAMADLLQVSEASPAGALALSKMYEHDFRDPKAALEVVERSRAETEEARSKRMDRLRHKIKNPRKTKPKVL